MKNCPNCGGNINNGDGFCGYCGTPIQTNPYSQMYKNVTVENKINTSIDMPTNTQNNNQTQQPINNTDMDVNAVRAKAEREERLLKAFIGPNYNSIRNKGFNWSMLFWGPLYLFYRKMYLYGIGWMIINFIISNYLLIFSYMSSLAIPIVAAIMFKELYLKYVKEEIGKIERANPGAPLEELERLCKNKGGVSLLAALAPIILIFAYAFLMVYNETNAIKNEKNVNNTEIVVNLDHFTKKVVDDKQIDYLYLDNGSRCEATVIIMDSIRRDITAREALEEIAETSSRKIMTKTINGVKWEAYEEVNHYIYVTIEDGVFYGVEYAISYDKSGVCKESYDRMISSIKIK